MGDENSSRHEGASAGGTRLSAATEQSPHARFWFGLGGCAAGPALDDSKRDEPEQQVPGGFQIETQIFCDLLNRAATIELRAELRLLPSQLQFFHAIQTFSRLSPDRCRIETSQLLRVLDEPQSFQ